MCTEREYSGKLALEWCELEDVGLSLTVDCDDDDYDKIKLRGRNTLGIPASSFLSVPVEGRD